jgi:uncharacterized protein (AIM24 family)
MCTHQTDPVADPGFGLKVGLMKILKRNTVHNSVIATKFTNNAVYASIKQPKFVCHGHINEQDSMLSVY